MGFDFKDRSLLARVSARVASWIGKHSVLILVVAGALTAALAPFAARVGMDDDVVKFLPEGDPDVARFQEIGRRFHGLSIALIGLEATEGDLFQVEQMRFMRRLTLALREIDGVDFASGLTEMRDVSEQKTEDGETQANLADLVGDLPESADAPGAKAVMDDIRARALSRDYLVGTMVSEDGKAAIVLCNLGADARLTDTATAIRKTTERIDKEFGLPLRIRYGGAPFIGAFVAEATQRDLRTLAPYVCGSVLLLVFLSFRSVSGMVLALASVLLGIAWTMGIMGIAGRDFTLVSSSLPVILIALGSAYAIHLLTRIMAAIDAAGGRDRKAAVVSAVAEVGPPIFAAGLTTALAFLSFLVMDIEPMREYGVWMSIGTMAILFSGLFAVPAACIHLPLKPRSEGRAPEWVMGPLVRAARRVSRDRKLAIGVTSVIAVASAFFLPQVTTHMDTKSFFTEDSEPMEAERFLEQRLGGSLFVQVQVTGNIRSSLVLRQIDRLGAFAKALQGVTDVRSISQVIALVGRTLKGEERIPAAEDATRSLTVLADDDPNLRLLVDPDWEHAIIQVKVGGFDTERAMKVARRLEAAAGELAETRVSVSRDGLGPEARQTEMREVTSHIADILTGAGAQEADIAQIAQIVAGLSSLGGAGREKLLAAVTDRLRKDITDDEYLYLRSDDDLPALAADATTGLRAGTLTVDSLMEMALPRVSDEDREDPKGMRKAVAYIFGNLRSVERSFREHAIGEAVAPLLGGDPKLAAARTKIVAAAAVLLDDTANLPASAAQGLPELTRQELGLSVSGYPILYAGMNRSVQANQISSTLVSFLLVGLALAWVFRSFFLSFVALVPAGLTLLVAFGLIGAFHLSLDIGMSMIAAIAVGVGIDYAVHLLWKHGVPAPGQEDEALSTSLRATGWGIIINTLAVTVGFAVLTASSVVPMRKFGVLTAACMLVSAVGTLLLVPALARWVAPAVRRDRRRSDEDDKGDRSSSSVGSGSARVALEPEPPGSARPQVGRAAKGRP